MSEGSGLLALLRRTARHRGAAVGMVLLVLFLVAAVFASAIAPRDPLAQNLDEGLSGPSSSHWMGQDKFGRDVLSRLVHGARLSLAVGLGTVGISLLIGLAAGSLAGFLGGAADRIFTGACDVLLAFPGILLALAVVAFLGPGIGKLILALSLGGWIGYARLVRGEILKAREKDYVQAARALGVRDSRLLLLHIWPNVIPPVIVQAAIGLGGAILAEATLSFLGLGVPPPIPTWGGMLNDGRAHLFDAPHLTVVPALAVMFAILAFNFLGDALRDRLDPRLRKEFL